MKTERRLISGSVLVIAGIGAAVFTARSKELREMAELNVATCSEETLIFWIDDVQAEESSIFERPDQTPVLPTSEACAWIALHKKEAADALRRDLAAHLNLGNAVLAGFLDMRESLPVIVAGWIQSDEGEYNGESPTSANPPLELFRSAQGIAYVIEKLAGVPLAKAVQLTQEQRRDLEARAAQENHTARAILEAISPR